MRFNIGFPKFRFRILSSLYQPPQRYWNVFMGSLLVILVLILMFDAWIFWRFSLKGGGAASSFNFAPLQSVRQDVLKRVKERINQKSKNYEKYKAGVRIEDPSEIK